MSPGECHLPSPACPHCWGRAALALDEAAAGVAYDGCPPLHDLLARYDKAGGRFMVCPVCFHAKQLDQGGLPPNADLAGSVQLWEWIGDEGATTLVTEARIRN